MNSLNLLIDKLLHPNSLLGGFLFHPLQHLKRLLSSKEYRYLAKLRTKNLFKKRFNPGVVKLNKRNFYYSDFPSFISMYEEIFYKRIYQVPLKNPSILDIGSNIGMSIRWFKEIYTECKIVGFEADPNIYKLQKKNLHDLNGITLINQAVWSENTIIKFSSDGADAGRVSNNQSTDIKYKKLIEVEARDIKEVLKEFGPFNFIKMDIEGAEAEVIPQCKGLLQDVQYFFCEYHSSSLEKQSLHEILSVFNGEGFKTHIQPITFSEQPFIKRHLKLGYDMQLNIFAYRDF
jgi:FkbM family methyltransferase